MIDSLQRIVKFRPAFDKRDPDPSKNYGIGCVECFMILKGEKGAVHFIFMTGMFLPETMEEYIKDGRARYEMLSEHHPYWFNKPMGVDVGYHSYTPGFEGHQARQNCDWLDGKPCYGDGSALRAEEWFNIFLREGGDKIWEMLEEDYRERFN